MNLKQVLRKRLFDDMITKVASKEQGIVMVLSEHTSAILSSCSRMYDVMEAGVIVLENVARIREPLPDSTALYFLQPTKDHLKRLVQDFSSRKPQYRVVYLYFTTGVSEDLVKVLKACRGLTSHLKGFTEINTDFIARESRVFTFDRPITTVIKRLYLHDGKEADLTATKRQEELREQAKRLVSLCLTLHEFPFIRYAQTSRFNISREFAKQVDSEFKKALGSLPAWKATDKRSRGTLLILDRSADLVAPIMHEYTYQAMVNDLLPVRGEMCTIKMDEDEEEKKEKKDKDKEEKSPGKKDKEDDKAGDKKGEEKKGGDKKDAEKDKKENNILVLSDEDPLWVQYRHNHIGEVRPELVRRFKEFKLNSKAYEVGTKKGGAGDTTLKEMIQAMKEMPKFKDMMRKYSKHIVLAQQCMALFDKYKLNALGDFEQDMATGLDNDGKKVSQREIKSKLVKMCQDEVISTVDKLRLLMIYLIAQGGISESTLKELMRTINKKLQRAVINLNRFGIEIQEKSSEKSRISEARTAEFIERNNSVNLTLMRYVPFLSSILTEFLRGDLSEDSYPYTSPPPPSEDGKSPRPSTTEARRPTVRRHGEWRRNERVEEKEDNRPLLIVFILGGVTFSETRTLYELAEKKGANLIIGSSNTITATEFVRALSGLKLKPFKKYITNPAATTSYDDEDDTQTDEKDPKRGGGAKTASVSPSATPARKSLKERKYEEESEEIGDEDEEYERSEAEEGKADEDSEEVPITRIHSGGSNVRALKDGENPTRKPSTKEPVKEEEPCCGGCVIA